MKRNFHVSEIGLKYRPVSKKSPRIMTSLDAFQYLIPYYDQDILHLQEQFLVLYLNLNNQVLGVFPLSKGGISATVVDVKLLMAVGIKLAASAIILSHNHPSGSEVPSQEDIKTTKRIILAASLFDIRVADHILVTGLTSFVSIMARLQIEPCQPYNYGTNGT